jgi:hypothetical protein
MVFIAMVRRAIERSLSIPLTRWLITATVAVSIAAAIGWLLGKYYDWSMWRLNRRLTADLFGDRSELRCEVELRPTGVWTAYEGIEVSVPWNSIKGVEDSGDGIAIELSGAVIVVPNRAFEDEPARDRFLERVRTEFERAA